MANGIPANGLLEYGWGFVPSCDTTWATETQPTSISCDAVAGAAVACYSSNFDDEDPGSNDWENEAEGSNRWNEESCRAKEERSCT